MKNLKGSIAIEYAADYDFLCKVKENHKKFILIDKVIASFYDGGAGDCNDSKKEALTIRRKYKNINIFQYFLKLFIMNARTGLRI